MATPAIIAAQKQAQQGKITNAANAEKINDQHDFCKTQLMTTK